MASQHDEFQGGFEKPYPTGYHEWDATKYHELIVRDVNIFSAHRFEVLERDKSGKATRFDKSAHCNQGAHGDELELAHRCGIRSEQLVAWVWMRRRQMTSTKQGQPLTEDQVKWVVASAMVEVQEEREKQRKAHPLDIDRRKAKESVAAILAGSVA